MTSVVELRARRSLPQRHQALTLDVRHTFPSTGNSIDLRVTAGLYDDRTIGEVFVNAGRIGSDTEAVMRDAAIAISLALQHGCPLNLIAGALTREEDGKPSSIVGSMVDAVMREVMT